MNNKLYTKVRDDLYSLKKEPFFFEDEIIDRCIDSTILVKRSIEENARLLAKSKKIKLNIARELLLERKEKYPLFNKIIPVPSIRDIASRHKNWIIAVDDESNNSKFIKMQEFFVENNLNISIFEEKEEFESEVLKNNFFIQYWLDWFIPKPEDGKKLAKFVKSHFNQALTSEIIVFTHTPSNEAKEIANKVISKGLDRPILKKEIVYQAERIKNKVKKVYNIFIDNPLIT